MPGRDLLIESRLATGLDPDGWFSFSLDPLRSLVAFCSTLAPAAMTAVGSTLGGYTRRRLAMTLAATAVTGGLLAIGVVLTQSRTGISLLLPVCFLAWRLLANRREAGPVARARGTLIAAGLGGAVLVAALAASAVTGGRAELAIDRFGTIQTDRLEMGSDAASAAAHYWPAGAGTGTFDEVFQVDESLEHISPARAGRAHNDYLELAMDNGAAGPGAAGVLVVLVPGRRDSRSP